MWKELARPGVVWYDDPATGEPQKLVITPEVVRHWHDSGKKMLEAGLSIPVPLEHQKGARPLTPAERAAQQLLNNTGWVDGFEYRNGDQLWTSLDIQDPEVAKKLPTTIKWTSPMIDSFTDGNGTPWKGVISHVALTNRPRIVKQTPFHGIAAAMSFAATAPDRVFDPNNLPAGQGFSLSKAGLLLRDGPGYLPAYPMAFSQWSGVALAAEDMKEPKKEKKDGPPEKKEGGEKKEGPPSGGKDKEGAGGGEGGGSQKQDGTKPAPEPNMQTPDGMGTHPGTGDPANLQGMMQQHNPLVDPDGDISVVTVICDLLAAAGLQLPDGTTRDNFYERLYQSAMDKMKAGAAPSVSEVPPMPDPTTSNQPPAKKPGNDLSKNPKTPTVESPPLYMSLEEIARVEDPAVKAALSMAHSLRQNAFNAAIKDRDRRIEALCKKNKGEAFKNALLEQARGAALSLQADGTVLDPMAAWLSLMEQSTKDIPALLSGRAGDAYEMPQPRIPDHDGQMSEERRQEVMKEVARNGRLPAPAQ